MRGSLDENYCWILHIRDHFSKFSAAFAMKSKRSREVAEKLLIWISLFGPPQILQCDNGREFRGAVIILIKFHGIQLINGRPRHPQTQGLIEQANAVLKSKLAAWKAERNSTQWHKALPTIVLAMNAQVCLFYFILLYLIYKS